MAIFSYMAFKSHFTIEYFYNVIWDRETSSLDVHVSPLVSHSLSTPFIVADQRNAPL